MDLVYMHALCIDHIWTTCNQVYMHKNRPHIDLVYMNLPYTTSTTHTQTDNPVHIYPFKLTTYNHPPRVHPNPYSPDTGVVCSLPYGE